MRSGKQVEGIVETLLQEEAKRHGRRDLYPLIAGFAVAAPGVIIVQVFKWGPKAAFVVVVLATLVALLAFFVTRQVSRRKGSDLMNANYTVERCGLFFGWWWHATERSSGSRRSGWALRKRTAWRRAYDEVGRRQGLGEK